LFVTATVYIKRDMIYNKYSSLVMVTREWRELHNEELPRSVLLTQYCAGDKMENNEIGGACSVYGRGKRRVQGFWWGILRGRDQWGEPGIHWRIILRLIFRKWSVGLWTGLNWLKDMDRWGALVNAVMNLRVP
jgi:hypothetical protein